MRKAFLYCSIAFALTLFGLMVALAAGTETPEAMVNAKDGAEIVQVPAGEFLMGLDTVDVARLVTERKEWKADWFTDEKPKHKVKLDSYWIYKYEVTVAQYKRFCDEDERAMPEQPKWSADNMPVVNVTWEDAAAYAKWAGARLPTEAEWEKAARGTDGRIFPWGDRWDTELCNNFGDSNPIGGGVRSARATPGGSYPNSASPYGAEDMAGNVWEWCADWYDADYYAKSPAANPPGPAKGEFRVLRGGSWGSSSISVRTTCRHWETPDMTLHDDGGFRCVGLKPVKRGSAK